MSASLFDIFREDDEDDGYIKYYIYAEDRKGSYLDPIYSSRYKDEVIAKLKQIAEGKFHKKWAKKYTYSAYLGPVTNGVYKDFKSFDIPYVQFTITRGECSWYDAVNLIYDLNNKKLYVDKPQINLHYIADSEGKVDIKLKKEWNGKLIFRSK